MKYNVMSTAGLAAMLSLALATGALAAKSPKEFLKDAIQGDQSEIMLGQLAQQMGASAEVKDFGKMLVDDHSKAKQEAMTLAQSMSVKAEDAPKAEAKREEAKLSKLSGTAFDREFATFMVKDHEKDIKEYKTEVEAKSGEVSALAAKALPDLEKHLKMAQAIAGK